MGCRRTMSLSSALLPPEPVIPAKAGIQLSHRVAALRSGAWALARVTADFGANPAIDFVTIVFLI